MTLLRLPAVDSTNRWAKAHLEEFGAVGAVWTMNQTAGRGRLGRAWANAAGRALYYTAVLRRPLADPAALPLYASLALGRVLRARYGVTAQVKWPNDLLLGNKKIAGILCESVADGAGRAILCGIGVNLAQPQETFTAAGLPYATSLALQGAAVDPEADAPALAAALTDEFGPAMDRFAAEGFAACRDEYRRACLNLGRRVTFEGGAGIAADIDEAGRLVVSTPSGETRVFTGEVSVGGIYGAHAAQQKGQQPANDEDCSGAQRAP